MPAKAENLVYLIP